MTSSAPQGHLPSDALGGASASAARLYGRAAEMAHLSQRWADAVSGLGGAVLISGEPGIGKTRLAGEIEAQARAGHANVLRLTGAVEHAGIELHPLRELWAAVNATTSPSLPADAAIGSASDGVRKQIASLLGALTSSADAADAQQELTMSPRRQRDARIAAVLDGLTDLARREPMLLVVDDAQWLDAATLQIVDQLIRRASSLHLLAVITARREFQPEFAFLSQTSILIPRRLSAEDARTVAAQVAGARALPPTELQKIAERSEGVPLFIEAMVHDAQTMETAPASPVPRAPELQMLLSARLDRLGPAMPVAQAAAICGSRFSGTTLASIMEVDEQELLPSIERLMTADILAPSPIALGATYRFRHALIQEAAVVSLHPEQRRQLHSRIAHALNRPVAKATAETPELLAYHCSQANQHAAAARHWLAAGKAACARGSAAEAVKVFERGLVAAAEVEDTTERERLIFELNMQLGPALMALQGYTSTDGLAAFLQARRRLSLSQASTEQKHVLLGLFNVHFGRGELVQALDVARQADTLLAVGYGGYPVLLGQTLCFMGRLPEAQKHLDRALAIYNPQLDDSRGFFCGSHVVATSVLAKVEFALGNLARSVSLSAQAMTLARQDRHPVALALAYLSRMLLAVELENLDEAQAVAEEAYAHVSRHDLSNYVLWVSFHRAALGLRTDPAAAVRGMQSVIDQAKAAGTQMFRPAQLGLLGAALARMGKSDHGLLLVDNAITTAESTQAREALPGLHRIRSRVLRDMGRPDAALEDVRTALSIAGQQGARTEQLRAAILLARMATDAGQRDEALGRLSRLYVEFGRGVASPDLKQAAALIAAQTKSP